MNLLSQLSSESGDKTQRSNRLVVAHCLEEPALLSQIAEGLHHPKSAIIGDCAEVFTKVAEDRPDLVFPYADQLIPLLSHKTTRVRWESMHALALIADLIPAQIAPLFPQFEHMLSHDTSTIVRDNILEALGRYATLGAPQALLTYPLIQQGLRVHDGKHRGRALTALLHVYESAHETAPDLLTELRHIATSHLQDTKGVAKKAAHQLLKRIKGDYR